MSIVTKTGDQGTTSLMYKRRVPKSDPRVQACGDVDELNAALGLARSVNPHPRLQHILQSIQQDLIRLMGELATLPEDLPRYIRDGFLHMTPEQTATLDRAVAEIESQITPSPGWALPGTLSASATLDLARTICRRAERSACALHEKQPLANREILVYLNRVSDLLWLLARWTEQHASPPP